MKNEETKQLFTLNHDGENLHEIIGETEDVMLKQ